MGAPTVTIAIYKSDWEILMKMLSKGAKFRDKFHEMILKEIKEWEEVSTTE